MAAKLNYQISMIAFIISLTSHWIFKGLQYLIRKYDEKKQTKIYLTLFTTLTFFRFPLVALLALNSNYKPPAVRPSQKILLLSDVEFTLMVSLLALSHSILISLCDICIGRKTKLRKNAQELGIGLSIMKLCGIFVGVILSLFPQLSSAV